MSQPSVAVIFFPRERFSAALAALASVVKHTDRSHRLVIFDTKTPPAILREMERLVAGRPNVEWVRSDRFMRVNEIRNVAAEKTTEEYVCFVENGCTVEAGWVEAMVEAAIRTGAGIISPYQLERSFGLTLWHHDRGWGDIVKETRDGLTSHRLVTMRASGDRRYQSSEPVVVKTVESHCTMFTRAAIRNLFPLDVTLTATTHVDFCMSALERGIKAAFAPGSRVTHHPMFLSKPYDLDLYRFRWDPTLAAQSSAAIAAKWSIVGMPDAGDFAWQQHFRTNPVSWAFMRAAAISRQLAARL